MSVFGGGVEGGGGGRERGGGRVKYQRMDGMESNSICDVSSG